MHEDVTLGFDFGTSSVKAVAMDAHGNVVASASASYPTVKPTSDRAEQDPQLWWDALVEVSRTLTSKVTPDRIKALGLSGQLNGIVLLDADGTLLGPALIWLDQRCAAQTAELEAAFGGDLSDITGSPASPIAILPKLRWLAENEPARMSQVKHVLQVKDYIFWRLTGVFATEPNEASATLLMNLDDRSWSNTLLEFGKVNPSWLSPIRRSSEIAGQIHRSAAQDTGLPENLPVVPGSGDTGALAVGCNAYEPGVAAITLGTAGHVVAAVQNPEPGLVPGLWRMAHVSEDRELWLGLIPAGGLSIAWLRKMISGLKGSDVSFEDLENLAIQVAPGAEGVVFLPFLEGAGTPWNRPDLAAEYFGLKTSHDASQMVRAVYEGVAYNLRACIEAFETAGVSIERIHLAEGGARSAFWSQMIADILGRDVYAIEQGDTSATGAAILALAAVSGTPIGAIVERCVTLGRCYHPSAAHRDAYEHGWQNFKTTVDQVIVAKTV